MPVAVSWKEKRIRALTHYMPSVPDGQGTRAHARGQPTHCNGWPSPSIEAFLGTVSIFIMCHLMVGIPSFSYTVDDREFPGMVTAVIPLQL